MTGESTKHAAALKEGINVEKNRRRPQHLHEGRATTPCIKSLGLKPRVTTIRPNNTSIKGFIADGKTAMRASMQQQDCPSLQTASDDTVQG